MPKICERGIRAAKKRYKVYPSIYANGYAVQVCKGARPGLDGKKRVDPNFTPAKLKGHKSSIGRWFKERWVDVCEKDAKGHFKPCGRSKSSKRKYPYCRPTNRVSKKTPVLAQSIPKKERKRLCKKKRKQPSKRISRRK